MGIRKWIPCRSCVSESFPGYHKKIDESGREVLKECDCHKVWRENQLLITHLKEASLPFSEFMLSYTPSKDYIGDKKTARSIIKVVNILKEDEETSHLIYFVGGQGTQKTTAGWWIGIQLIRHGFKVYYLSMQKLLEEIMPSFDNETKNQKKFYESVSLLIIDDSFSQSRVSLFKNKNYQLAPLNVLLRERSESSVPKHTLIIADTEIGNIASAGFGNDIEYLISKKGSVLRFVDEFQKEKAKFHPRDIFEERSND